jgi:hypothetical protein
MGTFRPKGDEVRGGWTKQGSEELHALYISPNAIGVMK